VEAIMKNKEINVSCVYCIVNVQNRRKYVGSTTRISRRKNEHLYSLRKGTHHSPELQKDYNRYGEDSFLFEIVEKVKTFSESELLEREQAWIDFVHPEYNLSNVAGSFSEFARLQSKRWHETHVQSEGERKKRSLSLKKYYDQNEKPPMTEEAKQHLRKINSGKGNPNYGLKRSKETIAKLSQSLSKRVWTGLVSPDGIEYRNIKNLSRFAREHDLNTFAVYQLASGRIKHHKRWTVINETNGVLP
jgi:group I intron endonuclease